MERTRPTIRAQNNPQISTFYHETNFIPFPCSVPDRPLVRPQPRLHGAVRSVCIRSGGKLQHLAILSKQAMQTSKTGSESCDTVSGARSITSFKARERPSSCWISRDDR